MTLIEPRVSEPKAIRFFARRRPWNLWGLAHRPTAHDTGTGLPRLELVWLGHYIVPVKVTSRRGPGQIDVAVEGHSGAFSVFERHRNLVERDIEEEAFPPRLTEAEAAAIGRKELLKTIMRRRGQLGKPTITDTLPPSVFYYPFWVYYYERRKGLLDIRVLDALVHKKAGPKNRSGILSAFIGADDAARAAFERR